MSEFVFVKSEGLIIHKKTGDVLNKPMLKQIVEGEGFCFAEPRSFVDVEDVRIVSFLTTKLMEVCHPEIIADGVLGCLTRFDGECWNIWPTDRTLTKHRVVSWLSKVHECIVCFENPNDRDATELQSAKYVNYLCHCGAYMCFGCRLDLMRTCDSSPSSQCPNCRRVGTRDSELANLFATLCESPSLKGMSAEQLAFIHKWTGYDGTNVGCLNENYKRWLAATQKVYSEFFIENMAPKRSLDAKFHEWQETECLDQVIAAYRVSKPGTEPLETDTAALRKALAKRSAHASAGDGSTKTRKRSDGCGNCGKSFWDKKEWRRAPKCPKCKRVAYCNAKCRKKHRKTHSGECTAIRRKPKAAKKPKKGCRSY